MDYVFSHLDQLEKDGLCCGYVNSLFGGLIKIDVDGIFYGFAFSNGKGLVLTFEEVQSLKNGKYSLYGYLMEAAFYSKEEFLEKRFRYVPYQLLVVKEDFLAGRVWEEGSLVFLNVVDSTGGCECWGINTIPTEKSNYFVHTSNYIKCEVLKEFHSLP